MPVTFTSHGYDTVTGNPYTESVWADAHPAIGTARYGVRSPLDWKVTAVAGQDRTVSINAGSGFGHGVTDKTVDNDTLQLAAVTSGSRWDLVVARRDWTAAPGVTKFEKVAGGATAVLPGGRQVGPGNVDDQPLALVQVTAGQTQPTGIIDLRTWSGDGGGLVANHDLVRSFMNGTGTRIQINGLDWVRRLGANDTAEWVKVGDSTIADVPWTNVPLAQGFNHWTQNGWSGLKYAVRNGWVVVNGAVHRADPWPADFTCAVIPAAYKPAVLIQGTNNAQCEPNAGNIGPGPAGSGAISFSMTWPLF